MSRRELLKIDELVNQEDACPACGERVMDNLVWTEDGETVVCYTCGKLYSPTSL